MLCYRAMVRTFVCKMLRIVLRLFLLVVLSCLRATLRPRTGVRTYLRSKAMWSTMLLGCRVPTLLFVPGYSGYVLVYFLHFVHYFCYSLWSREWDL